LNKILALILIGFISQNSFAQKAYYRIEFKDKACSQHLLPSDFLSPKAISKRHRHNIVITQEDYPVCKDYINSIAKQNGIAVKNTLKWSNAITVISQEEDIRSLNRFSFISSISKICDVPTGSSRSAHNKFDLENAYTPDYGQGWIQNGMIGINQLHKDGYSGEGMTIGVFDAGFRHVDYMRHFQELWNNNQILGYKDFVNAKDSVFYSSNHGMSVLSTMSNSTEGELVGTAPKANYWLMLTEDVTSETEIEEYNWAEAAEMADSLGIDVINSSLGYTTFDDTTTSHTYADMDGNTTVVTRAANKAFSKGILVVSSAGNSGANPWFYISAPADGKDVMAIGAVGSAQTIAPFSSRGPNSAGQVKPDVCTQGWWAAVVDASGMINRGNGTSYAGPILAGAAACLWQAYPEMSNAQIKAAITESAHMYKNPDGEYGYGIPNFPKAMELLEERRFPTTKNQDLYNSFLLFPNPANTKTRIEFIAGDNNITVDLGVYDLNGQPVILQEYNSIIGHNFIDVPTLNLRNGAYIVKLKVGEQSFSKKLVVYRETNE
jgi:subtilisin family serine protease